MNVPATFRVRVNILFAVFLAAAILPLGLCAQNCTQVDDSDEDSDGLCSMLNGCYEDPADSSFCNANFGASARLANPSVCDEDETGAACERCNCDCFFSCHDFCPVDPENDVDSDSVCGDVDSCPLDPLNDEDSDDVCGNVDSCPSDSLNDRDSDGLCTADDSCPFDTTNSCVECLNDPENDADGDGVCGDIDSCPYDAENDVDGDTLCADQDVCPDHAINDEDSDGICSVVDSCPFDAENDADSDNFCFSFFLSQHCLRLQEVCLEPGSKRLLGQ
eukprot:INCI6076.2.p1 GENE.INCI6076.2~~INCI6076.2.p1  ORF type:complete len:276 (-),score=85.01 INCI6076.2:167-994(-)